MWLKQNENIADCLSYELYNFPREGADDIQDARQPERK